MCVCSQSCPEKERECIWNIHVSCKCVLCKLWNGLIFLWASFSKLIAAHSFLLVAECCACFSIFKSNICQHTKLPCCEVNTVIVWDYCTVESELFKYHVIFIWGTRITKISVEMPNKRCLPLLSLIYLEKDLVGSGFHCYSLVYIWALVCTWLCLKEQTISHPVYDRAFTHILSLGCYSVSVPDTAKFSLLRVPLAPNQHLG